MILLFILLIRPLNSSTIENDEDGTEQILNSTNFDKFLLDFLSNEAKLLLHCINIFSNSDCNTYLCRGYLFDINICWYLCKVKFNNNILRWSYVWNYLINLGFIIKSNDDKYILADELHILMNNIISISSDLFTIDIDDKSIDNNNIDSNIKINSNNENNNNETIVNSIDFPTIETQFELYLSYYINELIQFHNYNVNEFRVISNLNKIDCNWINYAVVFNQMKLSNDKNIAKKLVGHLNVLCKYRLVNSIDIVRNMKELLFVESNNDNVEEYMIYLKAILLLGTEM
jgi:hypothetical protein